MNNEVILTIILFVGTIISLKFLGYFLNKLGVNRKVNAKRIFYISKTLSFFLVLTASFLLAIIWSVSLSGVLIFASSVFTVVGIALFAQWSILSNIAASIIIFFTFPARIGDKIRIIDSENSIEGEIIEIALFHIELLLDNKDTVMYPNNLFIQKPVQKISKKATKI